MTVDDLRKLAEAADTGSNWHQEPRTCLVHTEEGGLVCETRAVSDARYFAALSPSVVIALLDVVQAADRMVLNDWDSNVETYERARAALDKELGHE